MTVCSSKPASSDASSRFPKRIVLASAFLLLTTALLSEVLRPPAQHYEIDIYAAAPFFWICILAAASAFIISIIWQAHEKAHRGFGLAFVGLLLCMFAIFCHPLFAGYVMYGGNDPYSHLQDITSELATGHFGQGYVQDYYPIAAILAVELTEVTSLPAHSVALLIMPLLSALFSLFVYGLANALSVKREHALMAAVIGVFPFLTYYHVALYPHAVAILLFPMTFYLLFKFWQDLRFGALLILLLILAPFAHPIISIILVMTFFGVVAADRVNKARGLAKVTHASFTIACFAGIIWFAWWSVQQAISNVQRVFDWLKGESATVPRTAELQVGTNSGLGTAIELFLKMYGVQIVYLVLSLVAIALIIRQVYARRTEAAHLFVLATAGLTTFFAYVLSFMSAGLTTFGRLLGANATFWAVPILAALPLSALNRRKTGAILVSCFIVFTFIVSVGAVYRSPWNGAANWDFTYQDYNNYAWAVQHLRPSQFYAQIGMPMQQVPDVRWEQGFQANVPPHLGYANNSTLGSSLSADSFMSVNTYRQSEVAQTPSVTLASDIWGSLDINGSDLNRLQQDPSVGIIYTTGDTQILYVTH